MAINNDNIVGAIITIKQAVEKLFKSGFNKHAVVVLIQDRTKLSKKDIIKVLDSLLNLEKWYVNYEKWR